jgi:hypothetical protein
VKFCIEINHKHISHTVSEIFSYINNYDNGVKLLDFIW